MKTTLGIPCHQKHFKYCQRLVDLYHNQSVPPDEIIISASSVNQENKIKSEIPIKIFQTEGTLFAGENRNKISSNSIGDIIIFQDADDLPSSRRVEFIKTEFEKNENLQLVVHDYFLDLDEDDFFREDSNLKDVCTEDFILPCLRYKSGSPSIRKEVFEHAQWTDMPIGEDQEFIHKVYEYCKSQNLDMIKIVNKIILYRRTLSTWGDQN